MEKKHEEHAKKTSDTTKDSSVKDDTKKEKELQEIKDEIMKLSENKNKVTIQWGSTVVTVTLVLLSIITIGQTVQSAAVLEKINSGDIKSSSGSSGTSSLPSNLESLPDMVGGC